MFRRIFQIVYIPSWLALMGLAIAYLTHWWLLRQYIEIDNLLGAFQSVKYPIYALIGAFVSVHLFWYFGSRRRIVYDIVFFALFLSAIFGLHLHLRGIEHKAITAATERLAEQRLQLRKQVALQNQKRLAEFQERMDRAKEDRYLQYEGRIPDNELAAIKALDERLMSQLKSSIQNYQTVVESSSMNTVDDWLTARTLDDLTEQQRILGRLLEASRSVLDHLDRFEISYDKAIEEMELSEGGRRVAIAERQRINQYFESINVSEIRQLEPELLGALLELLDVLIQDWGEWRYDYREETLQFDDPTTEQRFFQRFGVVQQLNEQINLFIEEAE